MAHPHSMMSSSEIDALIHSHLVESGQFLASGRRGCFSATVRVRCANAVAVK